MENQAADELVGQTWNLGNWITAFAVAQSLTVIYFALEKVDIVHAWNQYSWVAIVMLLAGAGVYAVAIWGCHRAERRLRIFLGQPSIVLDTAKLAAYGRLATVLMFHCMAAAATLFAILRD
jgi:hypothetical protein